MQQLTVVSWNMLDRNEHLDDAFGFVTSLDADIICIQETPKVLLDQLLAHFPHITYSRDRTHSMNYWKKDETPATEYLVTISKFPISASARFPAVNSRPWKLRVKMFQYFLYKTIKWTGGPEYDREILSTTVQTPGGELGIINAHFLIENPDGRRQEFENLVAHRTPNLPTIFCGDYNTVECWYLKSFNFFRGGTFWSGLPWYPERHEREKQFAAAGLKNPLRGMITHKLGRSQLDHILVPTNAELLSREVIKNTHGSDHNPIRVTVRM